MNAEIDSPTDSCYLQIIQTAVQGRNSQNNGNVNRPKPEELVNALLAAEIAAKKQRLNYELQNLTGKWRLYFATGTRKARQRGGILLGKGFYLPRFLPTYISFESTSGNSNQGKISNQIELAGVNLKLTGLLNYLGKKNLLAFDFHQMEISLFKRKIYQGIISKSKQKQDAFDTYFYNQPIGKLPFFAFFLITPDFIAARGRGGGLAIWVRE